MPGWRTSRHVREHKSPCKEGACPAVCARALSGVTPGALRVFPRPPPRPVAVGSWGSRLALPSRVCLTRACGRERGPSTGPAGAPRPGRCPSAPASSPPTSLTPGARPLRAHVPGREAGAQAGGRAPSPAFLSVGPRPASLPRPLPGAAAQPLGLPRLPPSRVASPGPQPAAGAPVGSAGPPSSALRLPGV